MVDFKDIIECDLVKRVMEVAAVGNHSLLLFGPHDYGKTLCLQAMAGLTDVDNVGPVQDMTAAKQRALRNRLDRHERTIVAEIVPCPCGNYCNAHAVCRCSAVAIQRYRAKLMDTVRSFDAVVGIRRPMPEAMARVRWDTEDTETVKARVMAAKGIPTPSGLSLDASDIVSMAVRQAGMTPKQVVIAKAIGESVARLDGKATVEVFHMSEAIQYVLGFNNIWGSL